MKVLDTRLDGWRRRSTRRGRRSARRSRGRSSARRAATTSLAGCSRTCCTSGSSTARRGCGGRAAGGGARDVDARRSRREAAARRADLEAAEPLCREQVEARAKWRGRDAHGYARGDQQPRPPPPPAGQARGKIPWLVGQQARRRARDCSLGARCTRCGPQTGCRRSREQELAAGRPRRCAPGRTPQNSSPE